MALNPAQILTILQTHGYFIMFLLMFLEGPATALLASFLASLGIFNIYYVYLLSFFGNFFPDILYFLIGKYSRKKSAEKIINRFGFNKNRIEKMEENLQKHKNKTIILVKITPFIPIPGIITIGFLRFPIKRFILISFICNLIMSFVLVSFGFYSGMAINNILKSFKLSEYILFISILFFAVLYIIFKVLLPKFRKLINNKFILSIL